MAEPVDCSGFCRLCLVKEQVNIPIFEELGDLQQIYLKITACLPIKVSIEDPLPKRICDECSYKLDQQYQFWNTSLNSEKQLRQWLGLPEELPPSKSETSSKIKREKDHYESTTKRPRRNARRKAAQNVRQAAAAAIAAASDSGPGEDMDMDTFGAKEEHDTDNDLNDNTEPLTESTYMNVGIDSEEGTEAGPSGLQKNSDGAANPNQDSSGTGNMCGNFKNISIKQDPGDFEPIVTIFEFPVKKKLENVINKLKNQSDSEDDDLTLANLKLAQKSRKAPTPNVKTKSSRKKATPKKVNVKKENSDENDSDEDYVPTIKTKKSKTKPKKDEPLPADEQVKIKEEVEEDGYQNPFNYGYHFISTPARKRKPFNKSSRTTTTTTPKITKSKWSCLICLADLASKDALITHYALHKDDPIKQEHETPEKSVASITESVVQCQICGQAFETDKELKKHSEMHAEERFHCEICDTKFKTAYDFSAHSRTHTSEPSLKCEFCDFETIYQSQLKLHLQRHESDYKYKCEICNKGFFEQSWYEEHKNFHTGAKPFVCDVCEKPFAYTRYLTAHKRSLHPESYRDETIINECVICYKRFAHRKSLMLHMRGHTGENTVLCDICGKRLSSNEHLKFHRRIHTGYKPYTCDVCSKGFAKKCNLTLHLRVHSGEKPYVCDVCGKCFSQRSTLVIHERYHTGQRPYICHLCHKGFVAKGVLSIHLKSCSRNSIMSTIMD